MATGGISDQVTVLTTYNPPGGPIATQQWVGTKDGAGLVSQNASEREYILTGGGYWSTMATSAVAALVVRPSTTAALELFNNAQPGGVSLIVDRLFSQHLVSTAVNSNAAIWAMVTASKAAPSSASLAVIGGYGKGYGGPVINAVGTTVVANGWFPFGPNYIAPSAAAPGGAWEAIVGGRLIVPPQCSLCLHVVGSIVGDTYCSGASWYEKVVSLP